MFVFDEMRRHAERVETVRRLWSGRHGHCVSCHVSHHQFSRHHQHVHRRHPRKLLPGKPADVTRFVFACLPARELRRAAKMWLSLSHTLHYMKLIYLTSRRDVASLIYPIPGKLDTMAFIDAERKLGILSQHATCCDFLLVQCDRPKSIIPIVYFRVRCKTDKTHAVVFTVEKTGTCNIFTTIMVS